MAARTRQAVVDAIRDVAAELGIDPMQVTYRQLERLSPVNSHDLTRFGGLVPIRNEAFAGSQYVDLSESRGIKLRSAYTRKLERDIGDSAYLAERVHACVVDAFREHPIKLPNRRKQVNPPRSKADRELVAVLSDTHYGLVVDTAEVPGAKFDWCSASRRTAFFAEQMASWKPEYRDKTRLRLCLAGDLISGAIHSISEANVTLLAEQIHGATHILIHAIDYLLHHFASIEVVCVSGNHDRPPHRGGSRITSAKWDSFATVIHHGLQFAFRAEPRISFQIPKTPYATFDLPGGALAYLNHGDTGARTGNVGRRVDVAKIASEIYQIDAAGIFGRNVDVAIFGHVHVPVISLLPSGATLVVNGCLSGTDSYAQSINIHASNPSQLLFESVPGHPVGDSRIVRLKAADGEARLDAIIPSPKMF